MATSWPASVPERQLFSIAAVFSPNRSERFERRKVVCHHFINAIAKVKRHASEKMSGISGTRSDDFISAAKARGEAALKDNQPKLTKLENAFRHAALRRSAQAARRAGMGKPMVH